MYTRAFSPPNRSYFLLGPRGTGKTTWLATHYKGRGHRVDLLDPGTYLRLEREPGAFSEEMAALPSDALVIIDEVQKLPRLLDVVHSILSAPGNRRRFVLTGSSARKLKRGGANLLAGRASQRLFFPLVHAEHRQQDFESVLRFGSLPEVMSLESDEVRQEFLDAYLLLYLREEIQQEAAARNVHSFTRFLEIATLMNGQVVNVAALARDAGVARTTVMGYFEVLEDTLVGSWLHAWRPKLRVKETQHPKFFFFDPGVVRAAAGRSRGSLAAEEKGSLLETYLLHELRFWNQQHGWRADFSYWRSPSGLEVDFIIERDELRIGLEIKASNRWRREDGRALRQLEREGFLQHAFGLYLGSHARKVDDLEVLPVLTFLERLRDGGLFKVG